MDVVSGTTPTASSVTTDRPTTNLETTTPKPPHTDRSIKNELAPDILEPPFVPVHRMKTESRASESSTANSHRTKGDSVPATSDTPPIALDRPLPPSTPTPQAQLPPQPKPASKPLEGIAAIAQSLAVGSAKPSPSHTPMSPPAARPRSKADAPQIREELGDRPVMMVNNRPFIKLAQIGKGGSSKVYRVLTPLNKIFALKRVTYDPNDSAIATSYLNEVRLLGRLAGNPHIVRLFDAEHNPSKGTLTMMLEAVQVLHDEKIVHSDLKPANFLLVEGALKLIDFGIANAIANDTTNIHREGQLGTANYMPPEAIASNPGSGGLRKLGRASDVWSLGCILYQMVYGKTPFSDTLNVYQKLNLITNRSHKIPFPETTLSPLDVKKQPASVAATSQSSNNIPAGAAGSESSATTLTPLNDAPPAIVQKTIIVDPQLVDMMQGCLRYDAKDRFTIPELLDHPFVRSSSAGYCPTIATTSPPGSTSTLQSNSLSLDSVMAIMKRTLALGPDPAPDKLKEQAATILSHLQHRNK
ncbi:Dual-specificity kinase, spindle pole body (SPB) duplication and spindle checkpoint function [Gryganskiella cystojenkinii]|nr:Dual-specificity kinase, spindle pole body (SPB) duplication and spindle checkpoint function [Gryganskiella cystojenkinii]